MKRLAIISTTEEAGLGNTDIESQAKALRILWLKILLLSKGWVGIAKVYFDKIGGLQFLLRCDYNVFARFTTVLLNRRDMQRKIWNATRVIKYYGITKT